jgi:hypothetical protein
MIRPLTIATCLLACGSGLYLYQSKHEVQLLDRTIERTVHDTGGLREQSRLLVAEWTMLNDPERLRQFSDTYLSLKTITPSQFSSAADLNNRLPAPRIEVPSHGTDEEELAPVVSQTVPPGVPDSAAGVAGAPAAVASAGVGLAPVSAADEVLPVPPIPAMPPATVVASVTRPADPRTLDRPAMPRSVTSDSQPRAAVVADVRPFDQRSFDQRSTDQRAVDQHPLDQRATDQRATDQRGAPRIADARSDVRTPAVPPPRPIILAAQRPQLPANGPVKGPPAIAPFHPPMVGAPTGGAPAPYGGSLLGMAHGSMPPVPRPTPVSATYNSN